MCVIFDSSRARIMPKIVTIMAVVFMSGGIVMGGVFVGRMKEVINSPAVILPKARRVMGLTIIGLFSLIGEMEVIRVKPVCTSKVIRRL